MRYGRWAHGVMGKLHSQLNWFTMETALAVAVRLSPDPERARPALTVSRTPLCFPETHYSDTPQCHWHDQDDQLAASCLPCCPLQL